MKTWLFLLLIFWWAPTLNATTFIIAYEEKENPPYYYTNQLDPSDHKGVTIDVLNTIAKRLKFNIQYVRLPWARALIKLKENKIDGLFHASFNRERQKYGLYPMKGREVDTDSMVMTQRYVLYKHANSAVNWNGSEFTHLSGPLGVIIRYAIISDLKKMGVAVIESPNSLALLNQVQSGRLAGMVNLENMTDPIITKNSLSLSHIEKVLPAVKEKPYYIMFSHGRYETHPNLVKAIWLEMKKIKSSGEYQAFFKNH